MRIRARVEGIVQGVGFRPYVYRLARAQGLGGFVCNDPQGVLLEVEGREDAVERFLNRLLAAPPPLARIEQVLREEIAPAGDRDFAILESEGRGEPSALVSADMAPCGECLRELADPADRRFRYPFINCTNCGPRFTIVRGVPYDRPLTTMAGFTMCERCRAEYDDPADRRFHAQPNACPVCGPSVRLLDRRGHAVLGGAAADPVRAAATALAAGLIVAVKGVGGFHLACRADSEAVVATLRSRKHREDKPFAVMVDALGAARELVDLTSAEERLLLAPERPIVLSRRRMSVAVAASVAPRSPDLGVILPYSPLHHLLLADTRAPLVMTSGNVSDEPIAFRDDDALERLAPIADLFLLHDRPIHTRTDDSVVRVVGAGGRQRTLFLRRSRGYVPASIDLPIGAIRAVLACGGELKSTFCLAKGTRAWVGHHIGDLRNYETLQSFREGIEHFERLFAVQPEVVAHDLHPDYLSTSYAVARHGVRHVAVQHHHAHLAACLAEHGETGSAVGAIYDGTGYGSDGTIWGGELLVGGVAGFERAGHLWPVRLPGGDRAVREPWRMACAWLSEALGRDPPLPPALVGQVEPRQWQAVAGLVRSGVSAPATTSVGRLFDAVAALCGIGARVNYEGQAATELEALVDPDEGAVYPLPVLDQLPAAAPRGATSSRVASRNVILDARPTVQAVARDAAAGVPASAIAARFHNGLADASALACAKLAQRHTLGTVVLSGGVFQNRVLLERASKRLTGFGLRVLTPERLPPNDGGIAYGQAAIAASALLAPATNLGH